VKRFITGFALVAMLAFAVSVNVAQAAGPDLQKVGVTDFAKKAPSAGYVVTMTGIT
jgi:hypothetical protein